MNDNGLNENYEVTAKILNEENKEVKVIIYGYYKSINEALEGIYHFCNHGYNVVNIDITKK